MAAGVGCLQLFMLISGFSIAAHSDSGEATLQDADLCCAFVEVVRHGVCRCFCCIRMFYTCRGRGIMISGGIGQLVTYDRSLWSTYYRPALM